MLHRATVWILTAVITAYAGDGPGFAWATRTSLSIAASDENHPHRPILRSRCLRLFVTILISNAGDVEPFLTRVGPQSLYNRPPPLFVTAS